MIEEYGFAEEALNSVLRLDPEHPAAWAMMGEVYYRLGKTTKVDYCRKRLEILFPALTEALEGDDTDEEFEELPDNDTEPDSNVEPPEMQKPEIESQSEEEIVNETEAVPPSPTSDPEAATEESVSSGETMVPLEDLQKNAEKQIAEDDSFTDTDAPTIEEEIETQSDEIDVSAQASGIRPELFETATFAEICVKQGKLSKALEIYKKLLEKEPDNGKIKDKITAIESKIGS
jgi:tetratricopeptide (TPR) repeat protein